MAIATEAVIISGPHKGEMVELPDRDLDLIEVMDALRGAVNAANEMAAEAKALRVQTQGFVKKLRARREARRKFLSTSARSSERS